VKIEKMVSATVYMTQRQQWLLRILSDHTHIPLSQFVRDGIDRVLQRELPLHGTQLELPLRFK
jgi:hypothetical protein